LDRADELAAGVVDQHVQGPKLGLDISHDPLADDVLADISRDCKHAPLLLVSARATKQRLVQFERHLLERTHVLQAMHDHPVPVIIR
jgi:hypothetical protein